MKMVSVTGYVPKGESEDKTIHMTDLCTLDLGTFLRRAIYLTKADARSSGDLDLEKVKITVTINVERL